MSLAALRFSGHFGNWREAIVVQSAQFGFAGVEQRSDAVVGEQAEFEGGALDEVVDRFGRAIGDPSAMPVHYGSVPAARGATQVAQLGRAVTVGQILGEFDEVGAGELTPRTSALPRPTNSSQIRVGFASTGASSELGSVKLDSGGPHPRNRRPSARSSPKSRYG